jgi:hypothetical protein
MVIGSPFECAVSTALFVSGLPFYLVFARSRSAAGAAAARAADVE